MAAGVFEYWGWHLGALVAYREQTKQNPDDKRSWNEAGNVLLENFNRLAEAEMAYRKAIDIDSEYVRA